MIIKNNFIFSLFFPSFSTCIHRDKTNTNINNCKILKIQPQQKIEKPFLKAVSDTLGDRYTENVEGIYKITIKFVIETLVEGFETAAKKNQNHVGNKGVNSTCNSNANGANTTTTTHNGDTSCNSTTKSNDAS